MPLCCLAPARTTLPSAVAVPCLRTDATGLSLGFFVQPFTAVGHR